MFQRRTLRRRQTVEEGVRGRGIEVGDDGAAQWTFPPCIALTDIRCEADRQSALGGVADDTGIDIEHSELHGFIGRIAQQRKFGRGGGAQIEIRPDAMCQFEQAVSESP